MPGQHQLRRATAIGTSLTAQLVYTLSAGGPLTLALNGSATGPVISLAPSPAHLHRTANRQHAEPHAFCDGVQYRKLAPSYISSETLTGANGSDFSFPTYNSCYSIAAGVSSCSIPLGLHSVRGGRAHRIVDSGSANAAGVAIGGPQWDRAGGTVRLLPRRLLIVAKCGDDERDHRPSF